MVSLTINLDVMSRVGTQQNETFRGWYEMQRRALKRIAPLIK